MPWHASCKYLNDKQLIIYSLSVAIHNNPCNAVLFLCLSFSLHFLFNHGVPPSGPSLESILQNFWIGWSLKRKGICSSNHWWRTRHHLSYFRIKIELSNLLGESITVFYFVYFVFFFRVISELKVDAFKLKQLKPHTWGEINKNLWNNE